MIKIEKNIPAPVERLRNKWPFNDMEIGDSFAVPESADWRKMRSAAGTWTRKNKSKGQRLTVRRCEEKGAMVYRCWKLAA